MTENSSAFVHRVAAGYNSSSGCNQITMPNQCEPGYQNGSPDPTSVRPKPHKVYHETITFRAAVRLHCPECDVISFMIQFDLVPCWGKKKKRKQHHDTFLFRIPAGYKTLTSSQLRDVVRGCRVSYSVVFFNIPQRRRCIHVAVCKPGVSNWILKGRCGCRPLNQPIINVLQVMEGGFTAD